MELKTVGIITMHTPLNYGSYLQTLATYEFIKSQKLSPFVINYKYPTEYHKRLARKNNAIAPRYGYLHRKLSGLCRRLIRVDATTKQQKMDKFYHKYIRMTSPYYSLEELNEAAPLFDIYVSGSDQIWNPYYVGKDTTYLLSWAPIGRKRISYASSFAVQRIPPELENTYKQYLSMYNNISTREKNTIIQDLIGVDCPVVLDPTFLLSCETWKQYIHKERLVRKKYILCYILSYSFNPYPYIYEVIKKVKREIGYKVVFIDGDPINLLCGYKVMANCSPEDFLNLFYYSEFVVTTSFHGTAFALNFRKDFISVVNDKKSTDNRQMSLLQQVGISDANAISMNTKLDKLKIPHINYNEVAPIIERLRLKSSLFFSNALKI